MASNWAIVIGINDYQHHPERGLNYAVNDAQKMGDFLSNQAGFGAEHVTLCLGDQAHQGSSTYPTCSNLLRLLKRDLKPDRLGKVDRLWFYFSGHGVSRNGRDYLITSDCLEDEIERFALPIDEVIAALRSHQDADIVLILDACRQVLGKKSFDNTIGAQTIEAAKERGITTIFSCDYGQYSYELDTLEQGAFTYALIEGLAQHTLPNQLENYLRQRVPSLNLQHRRDRVEQTPRIRLEPASKAFQPLLPGAVTAADLTILVEHAREAELEENFEKAKQLWWQVVEVSQSGDRIQEARMAIDRVGRKTGDRSVSVLATPFHQLTRQQFLKWAIPAGVGVVGVTIINQFLGSQSHQSSAPQPIASSANSSPSLTPVDYSRLEGFLKAGEWKEADKETRTIVIRVVGQLIVVDDFKAFSCDDLRKIDQLWVKCSNGKFGFSVQSKIYLEIGGNLDWNRPGDKVWNAFCDRVGWRVKGQFMTNERLKFDLSTSPAGELPGGCGCPSNSFGKTYMWLCFWTVYSFSRLAHCQL